MTPTAKKQQTTARRVNSTRLERRQITYRIVRIAAIRIEWLVTACGRAVTFTLELADQVG